MHEQGIKVTIDPKWKLLPLNVVAGFDYGIGNIIIDM